jgi:hypothetical protein
VTAAQRVAAQRHVLCMKWGTKYGPEYVNRLYAMVRRHLSGEFNFVCLTDDGTGIRPEVQCLPIPPLNLHLAPGQRDGAWKKLTTFEADLHGLRGTALFLDVDVVVVGSLDAFFEQPGASAGGSRATRRSTDSNWVRMPTCSHTSASTWTRCRRTTATSRRSSRNS